jgi:hypothetical protein
MSWIECNICEEMIDVCGGAVRLPYICNRCEDAALEIEEGDNILCDGEYVGGVDYLPCQFDIDNVRAEIEEDNIQRDGVPRQGCYFDQPCQTAIDHVQAEQYGIRDAHDNDILDQFDADTDLIAGLHNQLDENTEIINDLTLQLAQANLNVLVLEETIEGLENQLAKLRLDVCDAVFGKTL